NGYLAEPGDPADLARGIVWMLQDRDRQAVLADRARRRVVSDFALETVARRHLELYGELLEARRG
ncbi:MAG: glycosyl transferase, partial [Desulfuromonadales bacterium]